MPTSNSAYRVPFHAIQVVYFQSDEALPLGDSFSQIWKNLSRLSTKARIAGKFWLHRQPPMRMERLQRMRLGDPSALKELLSRDDGPILGGGICENPRAARPICDADFLISLTAESRCRFGRTLPSFRCVVSSNWLERIGESELLRLFLDNLQILDAFAPVSGFVDFSRPEDCFAGEMYGSVLQLRSPLNQWVQQANWVNSIVRGRHQARGIYWGNYFGRQILERLGGAEHLVAGMVAHSLMADGRPSIIAKTYENGVFLSLDHEMRACFPGSVMTGAVESNLEWLHRTLCASDAIVGG